MVAIVSEEFMVAIVNEEFMVAIVSEDLSKRHDVGAHVWPGFNPSTIVNSDNMGMSCNTLSKTEHRTRVVSKPAQWIGC
jgi:hypothetical protein